MAALDGWLEGFMHGPASLGVILLISVLLGLRHASDPDHLAAVTTLIASEEDLAKVRKAGFMGLLWGAGHGTTLVLIGLPLVLFNRYLPEAVQQAAETLIGAIIILLAVRLLMRWRRGLFHVHAHSHGGEPHRHVHSHAGEAEEAHAHAHKRRTPLGAYGVGLVHGVGGSGGLTLLLLSTISDKAQAAGALLLFAAGTAVSMALLSTAFGLAIAGGPLGRNFERVAPVLGVLGVAFGAWYALGALGIVAYPF
ncbi:MAG: Nickel transporter UreH [uncultured Rubrobacteraceae bacterium]|uniref:Nickel/cobalt efflux system n=1 Tax=uncultured Rubrobacteraceae bacterium TaxID=349277 RepID=A0A6J4PHB3_9ACTN|nr:MAG: Nickel transporter UreH [uncultured Rubrobacteraceae bacterium]